MDPAPRTAVLAACFRQPKFRPNSLVRIFPHGWSEEVSAFTPEAVAASPEQLMDLASAGKPPTVTRALIALEHPGDPMLSMEDRQRLWRVFRVPVFEQIVGARGELLAAECEAHDGLHIEAPGVEWPSYRMELAPCGCGRKSPRLTHCDVAERARSAAAYAR